MKDNSCIDTIVKGIEISWTTWGKMRGENLISGAVSYLKSDNDRGFERIYSVNIEEDQDFQIRQMISFIKAGTMPDSMLITPKTMPSNLADILSENGFIIDDKDPCMIMYLDDYKDTMSQSTNFNISFVKDIDQLESWLDIVSKALFGCELVTLEQFADILRLDNTFLYLGFADNKPVTACMTITEGNTSVLELVATLKEYRRRGFATQAISKALGDLQQKGIKTISLRAEADGVGVYKRLGFKECFNRIVATFSPSQAHS